jgi:hypothetical protein
MKIPNEFKLKKYQYRYTTHGKMYFYKEGIRLDKYEMLAVINNKLRFCDVQNFPYLLEGFQASKLEYFIKLFLLTEKMGCYVYNYGEERHRLFIKDSQYINKMILANYLTRNIKETKYQKEIGITATHILNNLSEKDIYNYLLYQYMKKYFPQELSPQVNLDQNINDIIESKYQLLMKYDGLRDFENYRELITTKAENYIHKYEHSPAFLKFAQRERKNVKRLYFDPYISLMNPLYSIQVQDNVADFLKEIHLKPKNQYRSKYRY